jgi:hypothetical protein
MAIDRFCCFSFLLDDVRFQFCMAKTESVASQVRANEGHCYKAYKNMSMRDAQWVRRHC